MEPWHLGQSRILDPPSQFIVLKASKLRKTGTFACTVVESLLYLVYVKDYNSFSLIKFFSALNHFWQDLGNSILFAYI